MKKKKSNPPALRSGIREFARQELTPVQRHVYEAVRAAPGIDLRALARGAKIPYATVRHAVGRLVLMGYIGPKRFEVLKPLQGVE